MILYFAAEMSDSQQYPIRFIWWTMIGFHRFYFEKIWILKFLHFSRLAQATGLGVLLWADMSVAPWENLFFSTSYYNIKWLINWFNDWIIDWLIDWLMNWLDWNELFTTKCVSCGFPIEAGDRWVEALNNNYHSQCFNCTVNHAH